MVPETGLEPARPLQSEDFKSSASTIPPLGHFKNAYLLYNIFFIYNLITMNKFNEWYEYYEKNKNAIKAITKYEKNNDELFFNQIKLIDNKFVAKKGFGNNKFNEVTIKAITKAFVSFLVINQKIQRKLNVLICADEYFTTDDNYLSYMNQVLNAYGFNAYCFNNNFAVTKQFLLFSIKKIKKLDAIIYFSKFNNRDFYNIDFLDNKANNFSSTEMLNIYEIYQKLNPFLIKAFMDRPIYFDVDKLLDEYADFIMNFNFNQLGNKILNLGIYPSPTIKPFVKKILGWNDISYSFINNKNIDDYEINRKNIYLASNYDYICKFSYDYQKLYLYEKKSKGIISKYTLVDPLIIYSVYFYYINNSYPTNDNYSQIQNLICSDSLDLEIFHMLSNRYNINYQHKFLNNLDFNNLENNTIYFSENNKLYIKNDMVNISDAMLMLSILSDMLNYLKTQNLKLSNMFELQAKSLPKIYLNSFSIPVANENIDAFETKTFLQNSINFHDITNITDLRNIKDDREKYICRIDFNANEWVTIKYSFEYNCAIFNVCETTRTKNTLFKKVKQFFKKFLFGYDVYILEDLRKKVTLEFKVIENNDKK